MTFLWWEYLIYNVIMNILHYPICPLACSQTYTHTDTHTHALTYLHTLSTTHTCTHTNTHTGTLMCLDTLSLSIYLSASQTHTHTTRMHTHYYTHRHNNVSWYSAGMGEFLDEAKHLFCDDQFFVPVPKTPSIVTKYT